MKYFVNDELETTDKCFTPIFDIVESVDGTFTVTWRTELAELITKAPYAHYFSAIDLARRNAEVIINARFNSDSNIEDIANATFNSVSLDRQINVAVAQCFWELGI